MGYHFTNRLTRHAGEDRYIELYLEKKAKRRREETQNAMKDIPYLDPPYLQDRPDLQMDSKEMLVVYHAVDERLRRDAWVQKARIKIAKLDDASLEQALEGLCDDLANGEGTDRFTIVEGHQDDH